MYYLKKIDKKKKGPENGFSIRCVHIKAWKGLQKKKALDLASPEGLSLACIFLTRSPVRHVILNVFYGLPKKKKKKKKKIRRIFN